MARTRFYELYADYLQACAQGQAETWSSGLSGGNHRPAWSEAITVLLQKLLNSKPPSSYSACASELLCRLNTGARLYPSENLLAHYDFLSRVFKAHGLPLALYVDFHSFFYTHNPDAFTNA